MKVKATKRKPRAVRPKAERELTRAEMEKPEMKKSRTKKTEAKKPSEVMIEADGGMKKKSEIVTFKVDGALLEELKKVPNRSAFIRSAVLAALESTCPLCQGTGILSPSQQQHWNRFAHDHAVTECNDCHELYLVCEHAAESGSGAVVAESTERSGGRKQVKSGQTRKEIRRRGRK